MAVPSFSGTLTFTPVPGAEAAAEAAAGPAAGDASGPAAGGASEPVAGGAQASSSSRLPPYLAAVVFLGYAVYALVFAKRYALPNFINVAMQCAFVSMVSIAIWREPGLLGLPWAVRLLMAFAISFLFVVVPDIVPDMT